jgi:hypothetical protein
VRISVKFICVSSVVVDSVRPQNERYDADKLLTSLRSSGITFEEVDWSAITGSVQQDLIRDATASFMAPHAKKGRRRGNSFGTNRYPWQDFGSAIPVVLVYGEDGSCIQAYPHQEGSRFVTIADFATELREPFPVAPA